MEIGDYFGIVEVRWSLWKYPEHRGNNLEEIDELQAVVDFLVSEFPAPFSQNPLK
jgi:hypothetical protein